MNNKISLKIAWLFIIIFLLYVSFVIFLVSPKINSYLTQIQIQNSKIQFNKVISIINNKLKNSTNSELELLLSSFTLGKTGYIYVVDGLGKVVFDPSGEFKNQEELKVVLPQNGVKLFDELKNSYAKKETLEYNWNRIYDPNNYEYKKISWIEYNKNLDWYIISSVYEEDFSSFVEEINYLILNILIFAFFIFLVITAFVIIKIIAPINKMITEIQKANINIDNSQNEIKSKNKIGFLTNQFNTLLNQVEINRKTFEEQVCVKTKEIENKLYYDELTNLKNRYALEEEIKENDFVSITLIDIDSFDDINELYGFSTGNLVLIEVGKILNEFSLKYDISVYRIYGNVYCLADKKMMGFFKFNELIEELAVLFKNKPLYIEQLDIDIFVNICYNYVPQSFMRRLSYGPSIRRSHSCPHHKTWTSRCRNAPRSCSAFHAPVFRA